MPTPNTPSPTLSPAVPAETAPLSGSSLTERVRVGTGAGADDREGAEAALQTYLAQNHRPPRGANPRALLVSEVMSLYLREHAVTRPSAAWIADMAGDIIDMVGRQDPGRDHGARLPSLCRMAHVATHCQVHKERGQAGRRGDGAARTVGPARRDQVFPPRVWAAPVVAGRDIAAEGSATRGLLPDPRGCGRPYPCSPSPTGRWHLVRVFSCWVFTRARGLAPCSSFAGFRAR